MARAQPRDCLVFGPMELEPPNLIDQADEAEGWSEDDWNRWELLGARLEQLGVKRLERRDAEAGSGGTLLAETESVQSASFEQEEIAEDEPLLDAIERLIFRFAPPGVGP
jgi:hypothetical protein